MENSSISIENVPGRYYVNDKCIGCAICSEIAPDNFTTNHEDGHDYVYLQPSSEAEEGLCREAMVLCPVNAIGIRG
ncbi:MAG: ferredoxin [Desulfamplus sp.]|nr:ferredoxin [Desulfamplus sp.]